MYAASVLKTMLGETTTGVIPQEFLTTDRIMQRWAVANGSGLPTERWDDSRKSRVSPLDDHTALVVDQIVQHSPPRTRKLLKAWYLSPLPTAELASQFNMSPRGLEQGLHVSLNYLKFRFEGSSHITLLRMLRTKLDF